MNNLAIIPARGGSKRIPRKNIKDFLGKPIIAYSIEAALQSGLFNEVMVSTDDREIAEIAQKYGAKVPFFRSAETANDFAPLADVIDEVKNAYSADGKTFSNICLILPTAPFSTPAILRGALGILQQEGVSSVRPVVKFGYPIQRSFRLVGDKAEFFYPEYVTARSQDLEPAYHDAGMFYWMRYEQGMRGAEKHAFVISEYECQDIDTEEDWIMAELKYSRLLQKK